MNESMNENRPQAMKASSAVAAVVAARRVLSCSSYSSILDKWTVAMQ